jgi:hypothetical protein
MFNRPAELLAAFDLTGPLSDWTALGLAALVVVIYAVAAVRREPYGRAPIAQVALVLVLVVAAVWVLDGFERRALVVEGQMLERRAFELASRALMPGSALACLDPVPGETVENNCEKAMFASPTATAAAVSFVAAELSLLALASEHARRSRMGYGSAMSDLRHSLEADRFGIVAHVLATRDGCTPEQCAAFAFLQGTGRVSANLAERPFDRLLKVHMAAWSNPPASAGSPTSPAVASAKQRNNLYFPSAASIPSVSIMTAEPPPPNTNTAPARKPPPPTATARQPPAATPVPAPAPPTQLAPGSQ